MALPKLTKLDNPLQVCPEALPWVTLDAVKLPFNIKAVRVRIGFDLYLESLLPFDLTNFLRKTH